VGRKATGLSPLEADKAAELPGGYRPFFGLDGTRKWLSTKGGAVMSFLPSVWPRPFQLWLVPCLLALTLGLLPISHAYSGEVALVWDPNAEPDLVGYRVHYGSSSGVYESSVEVGMQTTCVVGSLEEARTYYFAATAYDIEGNESDYSEELAHMIAPVDSDGDGISDNGEVNIYGTDPEDEDTDEDGMNDGDELQFWGEDWATDGDSDGVINLLDSDSDDDGTTDGVEVCYGFDPSDAESRPQFPVMEIGELRVDHNWSRVEFSKVFINPVVIAKPASSNDEDPGVVRIRDMDSTGFDIRLQEWDYLDGAHNEESVGYVVMEAGSYRVGGSIVKAETFSTSNTSSYEVISFDQGFNEVPVVIAAISTVNESDAVTGRIRNISTDSFRFRMQEQELNTQEHAAEVVSYVAWEPSSGLAGDFAFEVDKTQNVVTHGFYNVGFSEWFTSIPVLLADMQTTDGGDTANVRYDEKDSSGVNLMIDEEQSANTETNHTTEVLGYMVFSPIDTSADCDGDGLLDGEELDPYGTDPYKADTDGDGLQDGDELDFWQDQWDADADGDGVVNLLDSDSDADGFADGSEVYYGFDPSDAESRPQNLLVEIGETNIDQDWKRIEFGKVFFNPVVIAKPMSSNDVDPAVIRIRNVGSTGFDIRVQEWCYLDGVHAQETVGYVVMEAGRHTLADGSLVEASKFVANNMTSYAAKSFDQAFNAVPVVVSAITTFNESDAVTCRIRKINTDGFETRMQEQELNAKEHAAEEISFIAWEPCSGIADGIVFEVDKTRDAVKHYSHNVAFAESFTSLPVLVADMQTTDGGDTANVRWDSKEFYGVDLMIDEEQSRDTETNHTSEVVGYMVFSVEN